MRILGVEVLAVNIDRPAVGAAASEGEGREVSRHAGDFGFGPLPGPTWQPLPSDIQATRRHPA